MFEGKLGRAGLLKRIIDAIKDLVTDAPFDCSENAFCLQAMDSSHVALVSMKLDVGLFESYRCDRTINLGISLINMSKALKCANNDDTCEIKHDDSSGDTIQFIFQDIKRAKKQEVSVKLMDIDTEHLGIPEQDYACTVEMPSSEFQKVCRDLAQFADSLTIKVTKGDIKFIGNGDTGSNEITYSASPVGDEKDDDDNESPDVVILCKETAEISFSIKYMNQFTKATSLCNTVKLSLSNNVPIVVEYEIEENGYLRFYLAPKIEEANNMDADR